MPHHNHSAPFDHHRAEASDMTQEFWGPSRGWDERRDASRGERRPALDASSDDTTGAIRAIRDGVTAFRPLRLDRRDPSGSIRRTRVHGGPDSSPIPVTPAPDATLGELAGGRPRRQDPRAEPVVANDRYDRDFDHDFDHFDEGDVGAFHGDIPLTPTSPVAGRLGLGAVDPLLARLGALVMIGVLLVPVALALRPSDSAAETIQSEVPSTEPTSVGTGAQTSNDAAVLETFGPESTEAVAAPAAVAAGGSSVDSSAVASSGTVAGSATTAEGGTASTNEQAVEVTPDDDAQRELEAEIPPKALDEAATADVEAERLIPDCSTTYTATSGDSWYAIASAADVSPGALMSQNSATTDTVILPGDEICLPPGASISTPVTTVAPASTATNAPTTSAAPTTATPNTAAPATATAKTAAPTTAAPTTAAPTTKTASSGPASLEQIKQMIRDTWPADQHEMAFFIANRESSFDPRADNNFCCFGVFQIYFEVHKSWLGDFGVYTASDLFDAEKNIAAAYRIYERSGGWGPWGY